MPMIEVTERDMLRSTVVEPAWYRVRIDDVGEAPSKDKQSMNYPVSGTILFNADTGLDYFERDGQKVPVAGVPLDGVPTWFFNSKAIGFAEGFIKACGGEWKLGRINLDAAKGKEIDVFVENNLWEGSMRNRVNHKYRVPKQQ